MELNHDFQEFLRSFVTHDVRFLIVGGLPVPFIPVDDLRTNKLAIGRLRG